MDERIAIQTEQIAGLREAMQDLTTTMRGLILTVQDLRVDTATRYTRDEVDRLLDRKVDKSEVQAGLTVGWHFWLVVSSCLTIGALLGGFLLNLLHTPHL